MNKLIILFVNIWIWSLATLIFIIIIILCALEQLANSLLLLK